MLAPSISLQENEQLQRQLAYQRVKESKKSSLQISTSKNDSTGLSSSLKRETSLKPSMTRNGNSDSSKST